MTQRVAAGQTGLYTTVAQPMQQNKFYSGNNSGAVGTVCTGMSNLGKLRETVKKKRHLTLYLVISNTPTTGKKSGQAV